MKQEGQELLLEWCEKVAPEKIDFFKEEISKINFASITGSYTGEVNEHYKKFFERIILHKDKVFEAGMKLAEDSGVHKDQWIEQLLIHDLSKFDIEEDGYVDYDFKEPKNNTPRKEYKFQVAWNHHQKTNKHHPEYWLKLNKNGFCAALEMERKYIVEMIADWMGASASYGGDIISWLLANISNFLFAEITANTVGQLIYKYFGIHTLVQEDQSGTRAGFYIKNLHIG